jgi:hypothetical protein
MIPKKPAPGLTRGGNRFSEKIMLKQKRGADHGSNESASPAHQPLDHAHWKL